MYYLNNDNNLQLVNLLGAGKNINTVICGYSDKMKEYQIVTTGVLAYIDILRMRKVLL